MKMAREVGKIKDLLAMTLVVWLMECGREISQCDFVTSGRNDYQNYKTK